MKAPTLKEMMEAKKATKQEAAAKKLARAKVSAYIEKDRNKVANLRQAQRNYVFALRKGRPMQHESCLNDLIKHLLHFDTLVYKMDKISIIVFERLVWRMTTISKIYNDYSLGKEAEAAQSVLGCLQQPNVSNYSPNQRRVLLRPLLTLIHCSHRYLSTVPERTMQEVELYCKGVQVTLSTPRLFQKSSEVIGLLFNLTSGRENVKCLSEQMTIGELKTRCELMDSAWFMYRVVSCFEAVTPPYRIENLKNPVWKPYSDPLFLQHRVREATEKWLLPFEDRTGIALINYSQYKSDLIKLENSLKVD